jgi:phosphate transport system substrate-binding protein
MLENHAGRFVALSARSAALALDGVELPDNMRLYVPDPPGDEAYPIVTLTWILLHRQNADPAKTEHLRELFRWCLTDGQQYSSELGYIALPRSIASRSLRALDGVQPTKTN